MKISIRQGVFETNSSSTHSLTIASAENFGGNYSFKLTHPLEKIIWLLAVMEECEDMYQARLKWTDKTQEELKQDLIERAKKLFPDCDKHTYYYQLDINAFGKDLESGNVDTEDLLNFLMEIDDEYYIYINEEYKSLKWKAPRGTMLWFKQEIIKEYCNMENISQEEMWERVRKEYNKKYNHEVCSKCNMSFSCTRFFYEGSIDDCNCGYGNYTELYNNMNCFLRNGGVKEFLSEGIAIYGNESWG